MSLNASPPSAAADLTNNLLAALRDSDAALLAAHLRPHRADGGEMLFDHGDVVRTVYFPCGPTLVSFVVSVEGGRTIETALIGREGAVGGIVSQGRLPAYCRAVVQNRGGWLLKMDTAALEAAKARSPAISHLFARYADCLLAQVFQSAACNASHSIEQRASKWLVSAVERTGGTRIAMTQDELASMLGVGRSYLSYFLRTLRRRGLVATARGAIEVLDPKALGRLACDCHQQVRAHFDEVLDGIYPG